MILKQHFFCWTVYESTAAQVVAIQQRAPLVKVSYVQLFSSCYLQVDATYISLSLSLSLSLYIYIYNNNTCILTNCIF